MDERTIFGKTPRHELKPAEALLAMALVSISPVAASQADFLPYQSISVGSRPAAVAIGDVNNDGRNDVVMTTTFNFDPESDYKLLVFLQDAAGDLAAPVAYPTVSSYGNRAQSIDIGDVDNDGLNEIVLGASRLGIEVFSQSTDGLAVPGTFIPTAYSTRIRIADLNNDGLQDVVGIEWGGEEAGVFLQDSSGSLSLDAAHYAPHGGWDDLAVGDVNGDGLTDIIVMSGQLYEYDNLAVLLQDGSGSFNPVEYHSVEERLLTRGVGVGDVTGDNRDDVVVSYGGNSPSGRIAVFAQNESGALLGPVLAASYDIPSQVAVADVTGDCRGDVVVGHDAWDAVGVYRQDVHGDLLEEQLYEVPSPAGVPHAIALGDINGDKSPDIVMASEDPESGLVVLENVRAFASGPGEPCVAVTLPPGC